MTSLNTAALRETAAGVESSLGAAAIARFRSRIEGPLAIVGSGGSFTTAVLWAHLHESAGHPAWALTPYAFAQRRLPSGTRVLVLSAGGHHHDAVRSAALARERGCQTFAVTCRADSPLARCVGEAAPPDSLLVVAEPVHADNLIAVQGVVVFAVVAARIYAGPGPWAPCFDGDGFDPPARAPRFVVAFGAGASEPAAADFANKCQESGLAPAWQTDVRNFAHGQFMMLRGPAEDALLVAFATRSEREYVERFAVTLPPTVRLHRIEVETEGAVAALSLLARSMRCFDQLIEQNGGAPTLQGLPPWGRALYFLEPRAMAGPAGSTPD